MDMLHFVSQMGAALGVLLAGLLFLCDMPPVFSTSLLVLHHRMPQAYLYSTSPALISITFPRIPGSFYWKMVLETKLLPLGVLIPNGVGLTYS